MHRLKSAIRPFLVALLVTAVMVPVRRFVFVQIFEIEAPFLPFLLAVAAAAWVAGLRSGLFATALTSATVLLFFYGRPAFEGYPEAFQVRLVFFVVIGGLVSWLIASLQTARQRMAERQTELEQEMQRRSEAEMALHEREERMRMAVDSADIGTWDFNAVTGERNWSSRAKVMFGLPPDAKVTNVSFLDRIHPEDQELASQAVQQALDPSGNGRYEIECRLLLPDSRVGWFVVKGQAFFDGEGPTRRPIRFIGTVMEITERKKAEQALREAEERFRKLAIQAPVGIFHTDADGRGLFVNDAWCAIAGATAEQAMGDGWATFLYPEDRERVVEQWQEDARNRRNHISEFRFLNKDTGIRHVAVSAIAMLDDAGRVTGYVGTTVDVTDRKAVEDAVRTERARLRSILDNSPAVISLKDLGGRYVVVNRGWEEMYGVSNDEIAGRTNYDLLSMTRSCHMSRSIADQFAMIERNVIETGMPVEAEDPVPDGEDQKLLITVKFPIKDESGMITGVGGIVTDVTERRKALDLLKAEQELLRKTLKEQDQERQLIAYQIHDGLIQDITGALLRLDAMRLAEVFKPGAESLETLAGILRRAVAEGRRIMNGIRTPVLDELGVVAAVEQLIDEEDRAHVQVEFVKDEHMERMDPKIEEAVYRITQEALTNVGKHSQAKRVRVELARLDNQVHLEIRDWGVGFAVSTISQETYGVRGMCERARIAGGLCRVESTPGEGTCVIVDLPYRHRHDGRVSSEMTVSGNDAVVDARN